MFELVGLTEEQVADVARMLMNIRNPGVDLLNHWKKVARGIAPYLQLPWMGITEPERSWLMDWAQRKGLDIPHDDMGRMFNGFISARNKLLAPKSPDPRREAVAKILADLPDFMTYSITDQILEAIDKVSPPHAN